MADELERTRWNLAAMVDLDREDSPYQQMDPKERFENSLLALATSTIFSRASRFSTSTSSWRRAEIMAFSFS